MSAPGWSSPERVRSRLASLRPDPARRIASRAVGLDESALVPASVLIALCEREGRVCVVLTKRAAGLTKHSGEYSFPGGRRDPGDASDLEAALREAEEEIGLRREDVSIWGGFGSIPTVTGYRVSSFVGEFLWPYELVAEPFEVDRIAIVALDDLASAYALEHMEFGARTYPIHVYRVSEPPVWGATGQILFHFLDWLARPHDT